MATKTFGHIPGVQPGAWFANRAELSSSGIHPPLQQGIHGTARDGADSIVVSGGYVDDEDLGDIIIYTGAGGRDQQSRRQIKDQSIDHPNNAGLITSMVHGLPVRVTRGPDKKSPYAPTRGYRYDGLYAVVDQWLEIGKDGYKIVRYRLEKLDDETPAVGPEPKALEPQFSTTTVTRRVRDSEVIRAVKSWHNDACQICHAVLSIRGGRNYSEGAHIRPLGRPHNGPDSTDNVLCLCPNHHAQLDYGGLYIDPDDLTVLERDSGLSIGRLRTHPAHRIDRDHLRYRARMEPAL